MITHNGKEKSKVAFTFIANNLPKENEHDKFVNALELKLSKIRTDLRKLILEL
jgi:hypothetical protein